MLNEFEFFWNASEAQRLLVEAYSLQKVFSIVGTTFITIFQFLLFFEISKNQKKVVQNSYFFRPSPYCQKILFSYNSNHFDITLDQYFFYFLLFLLLIDRRVRITIKCQFFEVTHFMIFKLDTFLIIFIFWAHL